MKKFHVLLLLLLIAGAKVNAQNEKDVNYRRSSLHTILIDEPTLPYEREIKEAFITAPFPDKYNDHRLSVQSFLLSKYKADTSATSSAPKKEKSAFGKLTSDVSNNVVVAGQGAVSSVSGGMIQTESDEAVIGGISKYLNDEKIANKLVAKWFDRDANGGFDMQMVADRGFYNASQMQANIAAKTARGTSSLADAGIELLGNTFVVVTRFNYLDKAQIAQAASKVASGVIGSVAKPEMAGALTVAAAGVATVAGKGYIVKTTSYLYRLVWNDSIEAVFYNDLWQNKTNPSQEKKEAFDNTQLFKLEFVGNETAWADLQSTIFSGKDNKELIAIATVKAMDAVISKLQRKYEVFKTKTPLYSVNPLTAKIGLKEGLKAGDKFEVLEQVQDPTTGIMTYVKKGTIKVDKSQIWDNQYLADESGVSTTPGVTSTRFKGGKNYYSGMLIRQVK